MSSIITIGVSFLLFFIVLGFMWLIGANILAELFLSLPAVTNPDWIQTNLEIENQIKTIFTWVPAVLMLFAAIKMLTNAAGAGRD